MLHRMVVTAACLLASHPAKAQGWLTIANPHWNITLSDFGYSDFLFDNTPGFEGREYLSGEWAAAVGYAKDDGTLVMPQWLENHFVFPNWDTFSTFQVVSPIVQTGLNADDLPIAQSEVANPDLHVTLRHEMIDTVVGTPMGITPASSPDPGKAITSDRYVLKQTCTIRNISGSTITNIGFFQFLHSLNGQRGVYDDRPHAGVFGTFRHDLVQAGIDAWAVSAGSSSAGLEDYIGFHGETAPGAYEVGYYGIEGNGVDDHAFGKPSDGVHRSVENNWTSPVHAPRQGTDVFAPPTRWVSGAQRWDLGTLLPNQSVSIDILLTLRTGTRVTANPGSSGGCNGGSGVPGGFDYAFDDVSEDGSCFGDFSKADEQEVEIRIANGEFDALTFPVAGYPVQLWNVEFSGVFSGNVTLTFAYDPGALPPGFDEEQLCIYQWNGTSWTKAAGTTDPVANTVTVTTDSFSRFALGVDSVTMHAVDITVDPAEGGGASGNGSYADGSSVTLAATAHPGYYFAGWVESNVTVSTSPHYSFTIHGARSLTAAFATAGTAKVVTTLPQPANGGVTTGDGAYPPGAVAVVVATANPGYKFSKWLVNGVSVSTSRTNSFVVADDISITAKFKPVYSITVTAEPEDGGELEADPVYEVGELAKLKAKPNAGYCFVHWTQNGVPVSTQTNYQFNVTANRDLVGHFAQGNRIDVLAEPVNAGSVSGGGVHADGAGVVVEATANPGYVFVDWTEDGTPVSTSASYGFMSSHGRTLVANFIAQPELLTDSAEPGVMQVKWPEGPHNWILQESVGIEAGEWSDSAETIQVISNQNQATVSPREQPVFYRLHHP